VTSDLCRAHGGGGGVPAAAPLVPLLPGGGVQPLQEDGSPGVRRRVGSSLYTNSEAL
jgi:hypothetical protein